MRCVKTLILGILLAATAPGLLAQAAKPAAAPAKPAVAGAEKSTATQTVKPTAKDAAKPVVKPPAKPAAKDPGKPATKPAVKATEKAAAKPAVKATAKPIAKPVEKPAAKAAESETPGAEGESKAGRRDPFESLVGRQQALAAGLKNLPPGKAGLQVSTLRLDGVVRSSNGMIAMVTNPQSRTYFLREGDQLYDGKVEKIAMDGVSFHEMGKDAFGKPVEREVNKRIYSSAGEQQ